MESNPDNGTPDAWQPSTLPDLGAAIAAATHLPWDARYRHLRTLATIAKEVLAASQDRAVYEGTRNQPRQGVATQLGVSEAEINRRVSAHLKRTGQRGRSGPQAKMPGQVTTSD